MRTPDGFETQENAARPPGAFAQVKSSFNLQRLDILFSFRALVFLAILVMLFFNEKNSGLLFQWKVLAFLVAFALSLAAMFLLPGRWMEKQKILSVFFILDTVFITLGLYFAGFADADIFLIFFATVFVSTLTKDVKGVFGVAVVACFLYAFLKYRATGVFLQTDTEFLLRFPFLFVAAALSGFLAMESRQSEIELERLEDVNRTLARETTLSAQKLLETNRELNSLLEYQRSILASIPLGVIVAERNGRIRTVNEGARQVLGLPETEVVGRNLDGLPDNLKPLALALKRSLEEEKTFVQDNLELRTGKSENLLVTLETSILRAGNGEVIGAVATLKDISLLRQMETQLLRAERFSALGEMAAGVAHEIKNPLNAILGFSRRLSDALTDPKLKKYAEVIASEVVRIDAIVNDVLEYSRPDRLLKTKADLRELLKEMTVFLHDKLEQGKISVDEDWDPDLPPVPVDLARMRQVVLNLLLNALQAMPSGGRLTLKTRLAQAWAPEVQGPVDEKTFFQQLFLQQKMALVSIGDNGPGIPKENLSKLFHPFFTTKNSGTGLGLSICQKIVTAHGGKIEVQSESGKGSVFTFFLPLESE